MQTHGANVVVVAPTGIEGIFAMALNADMAVVVEIHQGKRTVMEYLLSPVLKVRAEAARER